MLTNEVNALKVTGFQSLNLSVIRPSGRQAAKYRSPERPPTARRRHPPYPRVVRMQDGAPERLQGKSLAIRGLFPLVMLKFAANCAPLHTKRTSFELPKRIAVKVAMHRG